MGIVLFWLTLSILTLISAYFLINGVIMYAFRKKAPKKLSPQDQEELKLFAQYLEELGTDGSYENMQRAYKKVYGADL